MNKLLALGLIFFASMTLSTSFELGHGAEVNLEETTQDETEVDWEQLLEDEEEEDLDKTMEEEEDAKRKKNRNYLIVFIL